jgi:hypothetical protein
MSHSLLGLDEGGDALSEVVDIIEEPGPEHCSLMVRMNRSATPLP